jgi:urea transporter
VLAVAVPLVVDIKTPNRVYHLIFGVIVLTVLSAVEYTLKVYALPAVTGMPFVIGADMPQATSTVAEDPLVFVTQSIPNCLLGKNNGAVDSS